MRYEVSARTQRRCGLAEQTVSFDSSLVTGSTSQFGGATAFTVNMTMGRQLSRSQNVVVSAEYQHTKTSGATSAMQAYLAAWQGALGQRYSLRASAGIRPYTQAGQPGRIAPAMGLGLTTRLRRNDSLALSYERSVEQALGIGTHLTQVVTVG